MKNSVVQIRSALNRRVVGLIGVGSTAFTAVSARADDALATAAQAGITGAQTSGLTVGGYIVAAVAALSVIGLIIGLVKKL